LWKCAFVAVTKVYNCLDKLHNSKDKLTHRPNVATDLELNLLMFDTFKLE